MATNLSDLVSLKLSRGHISETMMLEKSEFLLATILLSYTHSIRADCCAEIIVGFRVVDGSKDCSYFGGRARLSDYSAGGGYGGAFAASSSITNL